MKGKHAARSVKRANEAAVAHIDRLTDKLTEAKIKARQHESAARELPASRYELERLRKQLTDETSDALERERAARHADRVDADERIHRIGQLVGEILTRTDVPIATDEWGELRDLLGPLSEFFPDLALTRTHRRNNRVSGHRLTGFMRTVEDLKSKTGFNADQADRHSL